MASTNQNISQLEHMPPEWAETNLVLILKSEITI